MREMTPRSAEIAAEIGRDCARLREIPSSVQAASLGLPHRNLARSRAFSRNLAQSPPRSASPWTIPPRGYARRVPPSPSAAASGVSSQPWRCEQERRMPPSPSAAWPSEAPALRRSAPPPPSGSCARGDRRGCRRGPTPRAGGRRADGRDAGGPPGVASPAPSFHLPPAPSGPSDASRQ